MQEPLVKITNSWSLKENFKRTINLASRGVFFLEREVDLFADAEI
jgi:hypothetical protein